MKQQHGLAALALSLAGAAQAQAPESDFSVSAGVRLWHTEWTTFSYDTNQFGSTVLTQVAAQNKTIALPLLSARYGNFVATLSGYGSTDYTFVDSTRQNSRRELDLNVGYLVAPSVALTLGYKKVQQRDPTSSNNYELHGPVLGVSASAPLGGAFSLYGAVGFGRLKDTSDSTVFFDADYRLSEVGVAYTMGLDTFVKALTVTAGYRSQVLNSKEALGSQEGRDLTEGITVGLVARF